MTSWYETFFSGLSVEFWIHAAPPPSPEELNFLRERVRGRARWSCQPSSIL